MSGRLVPMTRDELQRYLYDHIPLSRAMAVTVDFVDDHEARLAAPLAPNVNHRSTAFGGSIAALAVLAGWGWLRARLAARVPTPRLVVQRQAVEYLAAADDDLLAVCRAPPTAEWERFVRLLERRGRARIELAVEVTARGTRVATFAGSYVAVTGENP